MHLKNPILKSDKETVASGVWPVCLTVFNEDGCIDWNGYGQLLDWYVANGITGIFTVCLSGEMYHLSEDERLGVAEFTRARLHSDISVVAAAGFEKNGKEKLESIKRMADTGVDAVVVPVCQIADEKTSNDKFNIELSKFLDQVDDIKLGLYECPLPYRRLLDAEGVKIAADSQKVLFMKDTCCDISQINEKLEQCHGSNLKLFNANTNTTLESFHLGAAGFCGTGANLFPKLYAHMWECYKYDNEEAKRIQRLLDVLHCHICHKYPRSSKYFLKMAGLDITDYSRWECPDLNSEDKRVLKQLYDFVTIETEKLT